MFAQAGKQLFEIGQREILPPGYLGQGDRPCLGMKGEIQHGRDSITSFTG